MSTPDPRTGLVCIGHVFGAGQLSLVQAAFDAAGIPLLPSLPNAGVTVATYGQAFGGIALMVPAGHAEAALDLAASLDPMTDRRAPLWALALFVLGLVWASVPPPPTGYFPRRQAVATGAP